MYNYATIKNRDCQYSIPRADKTLSSEGLSAEDHEKELASLSAINGCIFTTTKNEVIKT